MPAETDPVENERVCPGCGLSMPRGKKVVYDGYYNTSPECWGLYTEVLGAEFGNAVVFGQVHQMTVDSYAVQHTGGVHPDKSIDIHLAGLYLVLEKGRAPAGVPPLLQRLAASVETWPHFPPPSMTGLPTVFDIAYAGSAAAHIEASRGWAAALWRTWSSHHDGVAGMVARHLALETRSP